MSYDYSATCGYGICVDDIDKITTKGLIKLMEADPDELEITRDCFEEKLENLDPIEILNAYNEDWGDAVLARIMSEYIQVTYGLYFEPCEDYDETEYLIYPAEYPWDRNYDKYSAISKEKIDKALLETVKILSDSEPEIKIQNQECVVQWG